MVLLALYRTNGRRWRCRSPLSTKIAPPKRKSYPRLRIAKNQSLRILLFTSSPPRLAAEAQNRNRNISDTGHPLLIC